MRVTGSRRVLLVATPVTVAVAMMTFFHLRLQSTAEPIYAELASVGLERFTPVTVVDADTGPSLKELLKPDETSGVLAIHEDGDRTVVRLVAADLFAAGSSTPNPTYDEVMRRVADALSKVPGRVMVVGHTDDQPVVSTRFRDNVELSRERAASVVRVLQRSDAQPARFESTGVGSSAPLFEPADQNRARNRRIEIIVVRGS